MKIRQVPMRVAMAMPLIGFDERAQLAGDARRDHGEEEAEDTMIATADRRPTPSPGTAWSCGRKVMKSARASEPPSTSEIGRSRSVRGRRAPPRPSSARRSRKDARKESRMVGIALMRLMMPPAATAPAPM